MTVPVTDPMTAPRKITVTGASIEGMIDDPTAGSVRYIDHWIENDEEGIIPAFRRAAGDGEVTAIAFRPGGVYIARPTPSDGGIRPWSGLRLDANGARIVVEPTDYLVAQEGRQRYQLVTSAPETRGIAIRDLTIEYALSESWKNLTLDGIHLEGEHHVMEGVTVLRPRAGAVRECFPIVMRGPGNYPNPTHRMIGCRVMWPQDNAADERKTKYIPEITPFFVGSGTMIDCQAWVSINDRQVAPCQGASGRGRSLTIRGTRIHVLGDTDRAKSTWIQLPEGSGLPDAEIHDNRVVKIY